MQGLLFGMSKSPKPNPNPFFTKNAESVQTADCMNDSDSR